MHLVYVGQPTLQLPAHPRQDLQLTIMRLKRSPLGSVLARSFWYDRKSHVPASPHLQQTSTLVIYLPTQHRTTVKVAILQVGVGTKRRRPGSTGADSFTSILGWHHCIPAFLPSTSPDVQLVGMPAKTKVGQLPHSAAGEQDVAGADVL